MLVLTSQARVRPSQIVGNNSTVPLDHQDNLPYERAQ